MSEEHSTSDIPTDTEESKATETLQVHNVLNETTHDEDDSSQDETVIEIEPYTKNGEQNNGKRTNSLVPIFKLKWKAEKLKGSNPIQQSNKFSNLRLILEITKNYGSKC